MNAEDVSSELVIIDEEFQRIRSSLYQSAIAQMEKIAKMVLDVSGNLNAIGSNMNKAEEEILNVIEKTDFLVESCDIPAESMQTSAS